jgi:OOP family OmpA-OmpF porin
VRDFEGHLAEVRRELQELPSLPLALENEERRANVSRALTKPVAVALKRVAKQDPGLFVSIIFPILGPIIRRSIADAISGLLTNLNRTLEHSFSWQGLKWRFEAWRSGVSFARVVLKHSLAYRVEHLFWIENGSGLLLASASNAGAMTADKDAVAGMLTAISDFVRDSILGADESLDRVELGELSVRLLRTPHAYLAAVVSGEPNADVMAALMELAEQLHLELPPEPRSVSESSNQRLSDWLAESGHVEQLKQKNSRPWKALIVVAAALLALLAFSGYSAWKANERAMMRKRIAQEPGIELKSLVVQGNTVVIKGARDPLAISDQLLASQAEFVGRQLQTEWQPLYSWHPVIISKRVRQQLGAPPSVVVKFDGHAVSLIGVWDEPPGDLTRKLKALAVLLPIDSSALQFSFSISEAELKKLKLRINTTRIYFSSEDAPRPGQDEVLRELARHLDRAQKYAARIGRSLQYTVVSSVDPSGSVRTNNRIKLERARWLKATLADYGVSITGEQSEHRVEAELSIEQARAAWIVVSFAP